MTNKIIVVFYVFNLLLITVSIAQDRQTEWVPELTEVWEPVPEKINPVVDNRPPSDAIVLFDGTNLDSWVDGEKWSINQGVLTVEPGTGIIKTKQGFGDIQFHLEWRIPNDVDKSGQARGNSGIFLQSLYEVQILDSYENGTYVNGQAGAIYKQHAPLVNASLSPGEWQSYDIFFEAPAFKDDGRLLKPAYITVLLNGVLIQNHVRIQGPTIFTGMPEYEKHPEKLPLYIQGSGHKLSFRNIWIRNL